MNCKSGFLEVSKVHRIFWRTVGNPEGIPAIIIHGGPGSGSNQLAEGVFDLQRFYVISYDQRGCGQSEPNGSIEENTTDHLINDIEHLRKSLGIDKWLIFAGSWGTTLGLLYSKLHPSRCLGLVLRGVTEWTDEKYQWALFQRRQIEPKAYADFNRITSALTVGGIIDDFVEALNSPDAEFRNFAAKAWKSAESYFELPEGRSDVLTASPSPDMVTPTRIQLHYWQNNAFIDQSALYTERTDTFPIALVHGQLDFVCPVAFAHRAHAQLDQSTLNVAAKAGHSFSDPKLFQALRQEVEKIAREIQFSS